MPASSLAALAIALVALTPAVPADGHRESAPTSPRDVAGFVAPPDVADALVLYPIVLYRAPVDAVVVDPFRPPTSFGAPGNRGLEYGTVGGEVVVASAAGHVSFAGFVAGAQFVTIEHRDGLRTSYSHISELLVSGGDSVAAGQPIARAEVGFHFGVRIGATYLDPGILLAAPAGEPLPPRLTAMTLPAP